MTVHQLCFLDALFQGVCGKNFGEEGWKPSSQDTASTELGNSVIRSLTVGGRGYCLV